jgi:hypothetical protein
MPHAGRSRPNVRAHPPAQRLALAPDGRRPPRGVHGVLQGGHALREPGARGREVGPLGDDAGPGRQVLRLASQRTHRLVHARTPPLRPHGDVGSPARLQRVWQGDEDRIVLTGQ